MGYTKTFQNEMKLQSNFGQLKGFVMDKTKELESRLNRLEDRLKATFLEIEKRFESLNVSEPAINIVEQRVQEIEDLLLLLQVDITKLKETVGSGFEFNPVMTTAHTDTASLNLRLKKLEAKMGTNNEESLVEKEPAKDKMEEVDARLREMHEKISTIDRGKQDSGISRQLDEIEHRLERLENEKEFSSAGVLEDVRKILHS